MAFLIAALVIAVAMTVAYILNGWALQVVWGWFLVPLGAPDVSLPLAIGVSLVVGFLTNHNVPKKNQEDDAAKLWMFIFLRPFLIVGIGWIIHNFT